MIGGTFLMDWQQEPARGKGAGFTDLGIYLRDCTEESRAPVSLVLQATCSCGGTEFRVAADPVEGCARRHCLACGSESLLADSIDSWSHSEPEVCCCGCGGTRFEVGVGFSQRDCGNIRRVAIGHRCLACGELSLTAEWKVDYTPTEHLIQAI